MGRKLDRLMARVAALEEAFTQLLSDSLRHGTKTKTVRAKKTKPAAAKKTAPKRAAKKKAAPAKAAAKIPVGDISGIAAAKPPAPKPAPIVRPASPTMPVAEPHRATAMPVTR